MNSSDSTQDSTPVSTPVSTPDSTPVSTQDSTPDSTSDSTPVSGEKGRLRAAWEPARRALGDFVRRPGWLAAGLALLLATGIMVTSLVIWRAAEDRRTLADNQKAAASAARAITEKMLGYSYQSFDQHTAEVSALLTGVFRSEFVTAAGTVVKPLAVENQAVVVAKVSEVSVMSPGETDDVRILAFVDQQTTSTKLKRAQVDQNRVILTMSEVDGRWLVSGVEAF